MAAIDWMTALLEPSILAISFALIISLSLPILIHYFLYRAASSTALPVFLIAGPSNAGKTALTTLLERGYPSTTHTSQTQQVVEAKLPRNVPAASSRYRSENDPLAKTEQRILLIDSPGHSKLRQSAYGSMDRKDLRGIIFVVDSATLGIGNEELKEAAEYLHAILLQLQKKAASTKSRASKQIRILLAANKSDLFTSFPASLVRSALEAEITSLRQSKARGLLDSGSAKNDGTIDHEGDWLGREGEERFDFTQMEDTNIKISVISGSVAGSDGSHISDWWNWIAASL